MNSNVATSISFLLLLWSNIISAGEIYPDKVNTAIKAPDCRSVPSGCSVITVSKGQSVFFGGNDDYINPDSYFWVEKGDSSQFGVIWIGTPDNPQQGVNEKGLAYDANGLPRFKVNPHTERTPVKGTYYHNYVMQIMHECSTVEEVISWANSHQRFPYMHDQLHFADKSGDAVIISAGKDGEMVFSRKKAGDGFLVSTNFNVANPSNGFGYPCWRFDKANELLGKLIAEAELLSYKDIVIVMDAVHQEGPSWTIETLVADLTNGVIYLYYFYQYDNPIIINVHEELANPREPGPLSKLFPENIQQEASKRYRDLTKTIRINRFVGKLMSAMIVLSLILIFIIPSQKKGLKFWIPAALILGPSGLLAKILTGKSPEISEWRKVLIETVGDIIPSVFGFLVAMIIIIVKMVSGGSNQVLQILFLVLPFLTAWFLFHSPLLAYAGKLSFISFLFQRLPQVLVTTLLALAGIFPVSMPLVNRSLAMSQIMPLSPWIVMTWMAITIAGSILGGLFVFFYENWAVKRGYKAWTVYAGDKGEVTTPGWSEIWWWILLGFIIVLAGLIVGIIINKVISG